MANNNACHNFNIKSIIHSSLNLPVKVHSQKLILGNVVGIDVADLD